MRDIDKVTEYLRSLVGDAKIFEFLEKPSPLFDNKCILDLIKEGQTDYVIETLETALNE